MVLGNFQIGNNDSFGWSPDSQIVYSGGHVVRLANSKACDLPPFTLFTHFIGLDSLVAMSQTGAPPSSTAHSRFPYLTLGFYDANCQEHDSWVVGESWGIMDASADRELLSVLELGGSFDWLIVNPATREVLHRGQRQNAPSGWFADSGRAICAGNTCWDVDTAKKIGHSPVSGWAASQGSVASRSSRVVLDDPRESVIPLSSAVTELAARRRIWDFRNNNEVVSWQLKFLTYWTRFDLDGFARDRRPIPCAISPDGEYIVEGGDGKVWLYRIRP
jgi:hypothetical protein